ncbi:ABC transporter substrate-binding protein [Atlantibacter subterranea]|uniref:ABC transporter substrate-binding protein n=1 Tax=Atlantibacter subterraneus TaxID=255519 RepID=UPI0020C1F5C4|nr:ABC transporter substrate-binding protein [Atlantibacter subterranea]UTJ45674.1 ABC transporter substrate-binding protein [Atlantibacter subterranea]
MPFTRRRLLQALLASSFFPSLPARASAPLTYTVGNLPTASNIQRIVSAGAPADLLLLAAAPEKLLGFSSFDFSTMPRPLLPQALSKLPKLGRLAGRATTLSTEKLMALNPDVIIDCGNADDTWASQARRISELTQIPWLLINGELKSSAAQLKAVGALAGTEQRTAQQADLAQYFIDEALAFSRTQGANLRFYAARGPKGLETGLRGSLHTEAAELLGLQNVASVPGRSGLAQVSMENLLEWQPEVILVQDHATWQFIIQDPVWQGVNAVAKRRILRLDGMPFGWLDAPPGINRLAGLRRLHAWLSTDVERRFQHDLTRYSTLFWHQALSATQFSELVKAV